MTGCNVNIPFYGKAELLGKAVGSVFNQSVSSESLEVTIFDDHSPEAPPENLSSQSKIECRVIRNPVNLGMVANWNRCLEYGDRECVHILHGDDLLSPLFHSSVMAVFEQHKEVGLVHTGYSPLFTRMTSTRYWRALLQKKAEQKKIEIYEAGDSAVRHVMHGVICSSAVLRREAVNEVGGFRTDLIYSSDEEYWARVARRWAVAYVPDPLVLYRYHYHNYQLKTWRAEDFWEKFQETRRARLSHLTSPTDEDINRQKISLARNAIGISHKVLAAGHRELARKYLDSAVQVYPEIAGEKSFRRMYSWVAQGAIGRFKAWLRSSH